jgi:hypothetical protein
LNTTKTFAVSPLPSILLQKEHVTKRDEKRETEWVDRVEFRLSVGGEVRVLGLSARALFVPFHRSHIVSLFPPFM